MNDQRIYNCLILNDYYQRYYATWVAQGKKTIETRMKAFKYRGELIICCGNKSVTQKAHLLKDWKILSRHFRFTDYRISGSYQSIFQVKLPDDVRIIEPLPLIKS